MKKENYINLVRYSTIIESFIRHYFLRIIVLYMLRNGVITWVAVSVPLVYEFAKTLTRAIPMFIKIAVNVNYKFYHITHIVIFIILGLILTQMQNIYIIYIILILMGISCGIKNSSVTNLNKQNRNYQSSCFVEEEKSLVIGGTLGLIISQLIYDISPTLYVIGFVFLLLLSTLLSFKLENIPNLTNSTTIDTITTIDINDFKKIKLLVILYAIEIGFWCIGYSAFIELVPLITNKVGYLEAIYYIVEIILFIFITGKVIEFIKRKQKLYAVGCIISIIDIISLLIVACTMSWHGVLIAYILMGLTAPLGDPIWGSILTTYANDSTQQWIMVNKVYFTIRTIFTIISIFICREIVIRGVENFVYLGIVLIICIILMYFILDYANKKILGKSI